MVLAIVQLCCTVALVAWWGHLLVDQAEEISELKTALSEFDQGIDVGREGSVKKMIVYESTWFIAVVVVVSMFLVGLYLRDIRRSSSLQAFFASLTHELKTPLTSIRLQAETIEEFTSNDQSLQSLSRRLLEDTNRLENRVERTLELARAEGAGVLHIQDINLQECIDEVTRTCVVSYQNGIEITNAVNTVFVRADYNALRIIITNLLENSLMHAQKDPVSVKFSSIDEGDRVTLMYQDDGVGVSKEIKKVGELFYRGKDSKGAGIGMYLVLSLTKAMRGNAAIVPSSEGFMMKITFLKGFKTHA